MTTRGWVASFAVVIALAVALGYMLVQRVLPPPATAAPLDPRQAAVASAFLDHLDAGRYDEALAMTTPKVQSALAGGKLQQVWEALPSQLGPRRARGEARGESVAGKPVVSFALEFGMLSLDARVAFDDGGKIDGFRLVPAGSAPTPTPPTFVENDRIVERASRVGEGETALDATLTLPRGEGPFPGVVLVHGSGPHDRDATIGPNKPFRDLAHGLAERGIAVLRYEKRTLARPGDFADGEFDIDDESTDDAVAALARLAAESAIDPARRYVIGHSLGAMLAPRIAQRVPELAGLVLLAAPARPLQEIYVQQLEYLAALSDGIDEEERARIEAERAKADAVATLAPDAPAASNLMQLPARYWIDLRGYDPVAVAATLELPMLLLQGERDYQVTLPGDYARWHDAFAGNAHVAFETYPELNHLLMRGGEGAPSPAEYSVEGRVDARVLDDIARWIGGGHARD